MNKLKTDATWLLLLLLPPNLNMSHDRCLHHTHTRMSGNDRKCIVLLCVRVSTYIGIWLKYGWFCIIYSTSVWFIRLQRVYIVEMASEYIDGFCPICPKLPTKLSRLNSCYRMVSSQTKSIRGRMNEWASTTYRKHLFVKNTNNVSR